MSRALRNHPCVLLFSAGNEVFHQGHAAGYEDQGAEIVRLIKSQNPLILPYWDSGGDLLGRLSWASLHYPAEIGVNGFRRYANFPFFKYWRDLKVDNLVGKVFRDPAVAKLRIGDKPIAFSEVGAYVSTHTATIFASDRLMRSFYYGATKEAYYEYMKYYVKGVRDLQAVVMNLWQWNWNAPNIFQLPATVYPKVCVSVKEEDCRFYSGEEVARCLNVHHDVLHEETLRLKWRLSSDETQVAGEEHVLTLGSCELARLRAKFQCPTVDRPTTYRFVAELHSRDRCVSREARVYTVYPAATEQADPKGVCLFDPEGTTAEVLTSLNIGFARTRELRPSDDARALIVGANAGVGIDLSPLSGFVQSGGRVVVLRQNTAPAGLPVSLTLANKDSSICYRRAYTHPLLRGLSDADFKYWRGDHLVSDREFIKPLTGSFRCVLDSGSLRGLQHTPLLELYRGNGAYVLCQLRLVEKWNREPMAAILLRRLVSPGVSSSVPDREELWTMVAANSGLPARLADLGVATRPAPSASQLAPGQALLVEADAVDQDDIAGLKAFVQRGGTLWVRKVTPECRTACEGLVDTKLELAPPVRGYEDRCYRIVEHPLLSGLSNQELYWKAPHFCPGPDRGAAREKIADFACRPLDQTRGTELTRPATLIVFPRGRGQVLIDQLRWEEALESVPDLAPRLVCMLLTNLGGRVVLR